MMKALVLGGSRFIGLHTVQALVERGYEVTVFNRGQAPVAFPPGVERLYGDRSQKDHMRALFRGREFDVVIDSSGYSGRVQPEYDPAGIAQEVDIWLDCFAGRIRRFVLISSTAVYARGETIPVREDAPLNRAPSADAYTKNKVLYEDLLLRAYREHGFPVAIVRPTYVMGPHNHFYEREAAYFVRLLRGRPVLIPGDGMSLLQGVDVDDVAALLIAAAEHPAAVGQAYNAAAPDAVTFRRFVEICGEIVGVVPRLISIPPEEGQHLRPRPPAALWPALWRPGARPAFYSMEKAKEELGFVPRFTMAAGLRRAYTWLIASGTDKLELPEFDFSYEDDLVRRYG